MSAAALMSVAAVCAAWNTAQPAANPTPWPEPIVRRLEALAPERPQDYLVLAEDIADTADEDHEEAMARTLYALGFEIARTRPVNASIAASCCLGLASLERLEQDQRWLLAVAAAIEPRYTRTDWGVAASASPSDETALKAATVLGLARAGEGLQARKLLDEPGVREVLRAYERAIGTSGGTGALFRLESAISEWPCAQCSNARATSRPGQQGVEVRLCPTCRGDPGPRLTPKELIGQLRFEAVLLNGVQRSWAAQVAVDLGAPLRDPDPNQLAVVYQVDASRPCWRAGAWVPPPRQ